MTGQMNDKFLYKGKEYVVSGISGGQQKLFDVRKYDL